MNEKPKVTMEITRPLGILSENVKGYTTEANMISWNGNPAKLDLRQWSPINHHALKGITLSEAEALKLYEYLSQFFDVPYFDPCSRALDPNVDPFEDIDEDKDKDEDDDASSVKDEPEIKLDLPLKK